MIIFLQHIALLYYVVLHYIKIPYDLMQKKDQQFSKHDLSSIITTITFINAFKTEDYVGRRYSTIYLEGEVLD